MSQQQSRCPARRGTSERRRPFGEPTSLQLKLSTPLDVVTWSVTPAFIAAIDGVIAVHTVDGVRPTFAGEQYIVLAQVTSLPSWGAHFVTRNHVVAVACAYSVVAVASKDCVVTSTTLNAVVAVLCADDIAAVVELYRRRSQKSQRQLRRRSSVPSTIPGPFGSAIVPSFLSRRSRSTASHTQIRRNGFASLLSDQKRHRKDALHISIGCPKPELVPQMDLPQI